MTFEKISLERVHVVKTCFVSAVRLWSYPWKPVIFNTQQQWLIYEIIGLKTARFRPAMTKTPLEEASSKKNAVKMRKKKSSEFLFCFVLFFFFNWIWGDSRKRSPTCDSVANVHHVIAISLIATSCLHVLATRFSFFLAWWPHVEFLQKCFGDYYNLKDSSCQEHANVKTEIPHISCNFKNVSFWICFMQIFDCFNWMFTQVNVASSMNSNIRSQYLILRTNIDLWRYC